VGDYGNWLAEYSALRGSAGVLDFGFRGRICVVGADRARFLHGQVTNDIKKLRTGQGCYAALVTNKGKMESDLNIFNLPDELLLDFEPGLTGKIVERLQKFVVADDVQMVDVEPHYGLLTVQGPAAESVVREAGLFPEIPTLPFNFVKISNTTLGEIYLTNQPRLGTNGFDVFAPNNSLEPVASKLFAAVKKTGGNACGWRAFDTARIEAGIPRFGADMDEMNLPLECGIGEKAVNYQKGCYIGQEVLNRIHSFGHVSRNLCGLRLADDLKSLPRHGDKLFRDGKEVGRITSAVKSPALDANIALGYVRHEVEKTGVDLLLRTAAGESPAKFVELPFV